MKRQTVVPRWMVVLFTVSVILFVVFGYLGSLKRSELQEACVKKKQREGFSLELSKLVCDAPSDSPKVPR